MAYIALVRPHLETCLPVWTPYQKGAQDDLEKVQKCAAKLLITSTVYGSTIIFVLMNLLPGLIDLHCIVQVLELVHIDILFL